LGIFTAINWCSLSFPMTNLDPCIQRTAAVRVYGPLFDDDALDVGRQGRRADRSRRGGFYTVKKQNPQLKRKINIRIVLWLEDKSVTRMYTAGSFEDLR
jgi:hypothetical protein